MSGETRRFRRLKLAAFGVLALALGIYLGAVFALNRHGYCWEQGRFLTDQELIDAAIKSNLSFHGPNRRWNKMYGSPEDVRAQNPDCCSVKRDKNEDAELPPFWMSISGMYASTVQVIYRTSDSGPTPFNEAYFIIGPCGEIGRRYGMDWATLPAFLKWK